MPTNVAQHERYYSRQVARLGVEGVGVNGSYFLKGDVVVRRNGTIFISAKGYTAAMDFARKHGGSVLFSARAALISGNSEVRSEMFERSQSVEAWNGDHFMPIGSCILKIPNSYPNIEYTISIKYWYGYDTGNGTVYPVPHPGEESIQINVTEALP